MILASILCGFVRLMRPAAICAPSEVGMKERQFSAIKKAEQRRRAVAREPELIDQRVVVSRPENAFDNQAEEQLRLLKTAIEQSDESVIIMGARHDPPGPVIFYVNPAFTKMTGYAPEDVIGKTPHILQGPETDRSVLRRLCKDCAAGEAFHGETINYRKDRSEIYLEWTVGPARSVAVKCVTCPRSLSAGPTVNDRGQVTHFTATL